jgi:ADP-heptose:LPS heptosyltransferase
MHRSAPILLIFHPGALGDGLLALPALRALQNSFPRHRMIWFGHKELGGLFVNAHEVHQSFSFEKLSFLVYSESADVQQGMIPSLFGRCERAVGWMEDSDGIWRSWLRRVGIKNLILRSPHDPSLRHAPMADRYIEILQPWFSTQQTSHQSEQSVRDEPILVLDPSKTVRQSSFFTEPLIVLHPGSGSPNKCAPPALLVNIIKGLTAVRPHFILCLIGGPADADALRKVQGLLTHLEPIILADLDLLSVGRYLAHAQLFIGHDSGLSHLAARLGVPSILLFGPTDPAKWAPRGTHVAAMRKSCHCMEKGSMTQCTDKCYFSIPVNEVVTKAESWAPCW